MPLTIPSFLHDKETWDYYGSDGHRTAKDNINNIFSGLNTAPQLIAYTGNSNTSIDNAHVHLLLNMLHYDTENCPRIQIGYVRKVLQRVDDANHYANNGWMSHTHGPTIEIIHVSGGSANMNEMTREHELKAVSVALQRSTQHKIRVIQKEPDRVTILTNVYNWELYYKILSLIPKVFEQYYPNTSTELKVMLKALREDNHEEFCRAWNVWEARTNIVEGRKIKQLQRLFAQEQQKHINNLKNSIAAAESQIANWEESIRQYLQQREQYLMTLYGFENQTVNSDKIQELVDYLDSNKSIIDYSTNGESLFVTSRAPIKYIDLDALESIFLSKRTDPHIPDRERNLYNLYDEAFVKGHYEIWTAAKNQFHIPKRDVFSETGFDARPLYKHPHLGGFNCWGNNKSHIQRALRDMDLIGAVEQANAAVMNLNVVDATVMGRFAMYIVQDDGPLRESIYHPDTDTWIAFRDFPEHHRKHYVEKESEEADAATNDNPGTEGSDPEGLSAVPADDIPFER